MPVVPTGNHWLLCLFFRDCRRRFLPLLCLLLATAGAPAGEPETSLPAALQRALERNLAGRSGTAVVLDVDSGRLLAHHRLDLAARRLVRPGSALKPFTLLALLESGTLDPSTTLLCRRQLRLADRRLDCTHPPTTAPLDAVSALAYSCNYYFAHFAAQLRDSDLAQALVRAGLSSPTGLADEEAVGFVRPTNGVEQRQLLVLGESNIEITPLELLAAYRKLALRRKQAESRDEPLATVFAGLEGSTTYGTGRLAQPPGLDVAGKTGTSLASEGNWSHAWFVGYAPAQDPQIVLVVFLERGRGGSDAAPIAREIFAAYQAARGAP